MSATTKAPLLLLGAAFYHRSCLPPARPASASEQKRTDKQITLLEKIMAHPLLPFWAPSMYWAISITDAAVTLNKRSQAPLSATFLTGTAILLIGTSLRILCFRVLGRHFTLAMSLQDDHSLVTSGPYAVVRHPSYTGGLLQALGACLVGAGAGSWLADGGYATPWGAFLGLNLAILTVMWGYACTRGAKEDEFLAEKFGEKWKVYAQAVPYRYVPGVC